MFVKKSLFWFIITNIYINNGYLKTSESFSSFFLKIKILLFLNLTLFCLISRLFKGYVQDSEQSYLDNFQTLVTAELLYSNSFFHSYQTLGTKKR